MANTVTYQIGNSSAVAGIVGFAYLTSTPVLTAANTLETDLFNYTIPAGALTGAADVFVINAGGAFGGTDNDKTLRLKVQTGPGPTFTTIHTFSEANLPSGHLNGLGWALDVRIFGTPTVASVFSGIKIEMGADGDAAAPLTSAAGTTSLAIDNTADIIVKVTGQNAVATATDYSGEEQEIPASPGPYTVTVDHVTDSINDAGVLLGSTPMVKVVSGPATGEYSVDESTGVYTFAAADAEGTVFITYSDITAGTFAAGDVIFGLGYVQYLSSPS